MSDPRGGWTDPGIIEPNPDGSVTWRPTPSEKAGADTGAVGERPDFDNQTEACRHCPTPEVHPKRIGGTLAYPNPDACCSRNVFEDDAHSRSCPNWAGGAVGEREPINGQPPKFPPLDVERLARALRDVEVQSGSLTIEYWIAYARRVAAEYARLSVNEGGVAPVEPQEPR